MNNILRITKKVALNNNLTRLISCNTFQTIIIPTMSANDQKGELIQVFFINFWFLFSFCCCSLVFWLEIFKTYFGKSVDLLVFSAGFSVLLGNLHKKYRLLKICAKILFMKLV